jgi:hypothetical protein
LARRVAQLIDRDDPASLELACDLRLFDEPADHGRVVAVPIQQDLDGQVVPQVGAAALEDHPHPPAGDLPEQLAPPGHGGKRRHLGRAAPGRIADIMDHIKERSRVKRPKAKVL